MTAAGRDAPARETPAAWREMLPYRLYRVGEGLVRVLPRSVAYSLGARIADVLVTVNPRDFDGLRANLRHALPDADERSIAKVTRRNVRNLTRSWVDVMEMRWRAEKAASRLDAACPEHFLAAYRRGSGVVAVSLHLGSWEAGLAGWNFSGGDMGLLAELLRPRELFDRVVGARSNLGVRVIPIDVSAIRTSDPARARSLAAAATREVYRVLRAGSTLAVAIDRDLIGNGVPVPFFGEKAPIPVGAIEVAIRNGAAIVPVAMIRTRRGVRGVCFPEVEYDAAAPLDAEVLRVTGRVLRIFEDVIRSHPDQWHVLDPIWPVPGEPSTAPADGAGRREPQSAGARR